MEVTYLGPLERAYRRMVAMLFRPFDPAKWLIVGFACWLARLTSGGGGGGPYTWTLDHGDAEAAVPAILEVARPPLDLFGSMGRAWGMGLATVLVGCVVVVVLTLIVLLIWLSSRGHFLFIDNVILDRGAIVEPWKEYRREGNSLFLWRLGFLVVAIVTVMLAMLPGFLLLLLSARTSEWLVVPAIVAWVIPLLLVVILLAYVDMFLRDFVVPIMVRDRVTTTEGWRRFLPLLRRHTADLVLYGLFVLGLHILVGIALVVVILATCCIAGLLLILPYLGTVILLPLHVTYRALSLEFLAQLGPEYDLFAATPPPAPPADEDSPEEAGGPADASPRPEEPGA